MVIEFFFYIIKEYFTELKTPEADILLVPAQVVLNKYI